MSNRTAHPIVEPDELSSMFQALDDLRESGEMNMFGAPAVLRDEFDVDKMTSFKLFIMVVLLITAADYNRCY